MAALGSCLFGPNPAAQVLGLLPDEAFFTPAHRMVAAAMRLEHRKGAIDIVTLKNRLQAGGQLDEIGGPGYLARLAESVPSPANAAYYAGIVLESWQRRKGDDLVRAWQKGFTDEDVPVEDTITAIARAAKDPAWLNRPSPILPEDIDLSRPQAGLETGIPWIDKWTGWGLPSGLVICSAYHKGGKTALSVQVAREVHKQGHAVIYASFADLSPKDLMRRMIRQECGWSERPSYSQEAMDEYDRALEGFTGAFNGDWLFYYGKVHGRNVEDLCRFVRAHSKDRPIPLVVVDYAQKIHSSALPDHKHGKTAELEHVSQEIKELADDLDCVAWLGSQITKGEKGEWMTKYARGLEEDADMVFRIKREQGSQYAKIEVPYARHSDVGTTDVEWDSTHLLFKAPQYGKERD